LLFTDPVYQKLYPANNYSGYIRYTRNSISQYSQPQDKMFRLAHQGIDDPQIKALLEIYETVKFGNRKAKDSGDSIATQSWEEAAKALLAPANTSLAQKSLLLTPF